jgi:hypothetical protein
MSLIKRLDDIEYQRWWQLHLRAAKSEKLDPVEQKEYDSGLELLDREEKAQFELSDLTVLRRLRGEIEQLRAIHSQLLAKSARLDEQIIVLENAYRSLTGYELAGTSCASP